MNWFVIFSETRGIYLGQGEWSNIKNGRGVDNAPCYGPKTGQLIMKTLGSSDTNPLQLKPVFPDLIGVDNLKYASERACVNAGFKHWNPEAFKVSNND